MRPPRAVWRSALSIRLTKTCDSRVAIGLDAHRTQCRQFERNAFVGGLLLERRDDGPRDVFEIHVVEVEPQLSRFGARLLEELTHECGQAVDLR